MIYWNHATSSSNWASMPTVALFVHKQSQVNIMFFMFSNHCNSEGNVRNEQTFNKCLSPTTIIIRMSKQSPTNPQLSPKTQDPALAQPVIVWASAAESWALGTIILEPGDTPRQPAAANRAPARDPGLLITRASRGGSRRFHKHGEDPACNLWSCASVPVSCLQVNTCGSVLVVS